MMTAIPLPPSRNSNQATTVVLKKAIEVVTKGKSDIASASPGR